MGLEIAWTLWANQVPLEPYEVSMCPYFLHDYGVPRCQCRGIHNSRWMHWDYLTWCLIYDGPIYIKIGGQYFQVGHWDRLHEDFIDSYCREDLMPCDGGIKMRSLIGHRHDPLWKSGMMCLVLYLFHH